MLDSLLLAALLLDVPATPAEPAAVAEQQLGTIRALARGEGVRRNEPRTPASFWQDTEDAHQRLRELGLRYMQEHPDDPRRWEAAMWMLIYSPQFVTVSAPSGGPSGRPRFEHDLPAREAWEAQLRELRFQLWTAGDVPASVCEQLASVEIIRGLSGVARSRDHERLAFLQARLDGLAAQFPESTLLAGAQGNELNILRNLAPEQFEERVRRLAISPNRHIRALAEGKLRVIDASVHPLELKFTALDGREVDLAKLRGKVVLIDFWATWCGPCIAELPNVKRVYENYRDRGFSIVGISLDQANDRQKLIDFVSTHGMPWPQHFDGKYWQNEIALRFSVDAVPAMFLLGPNGRVASTNARGELLEREVRHLLGL